MINNQPPADLPITTGETAPTLLIRDDDGFVGAILNQSGMSLSGMSVSGGVSADRLSLQSDDSTLCFADEDGYSQAQIDQSGLSVGGVLSVGHAIISGDGGTLAVRDEDGYVGAAFAPGSAKFGGVDFVVGDAGAFVYGVIDEDGYIASGLLQDGTSYPIVDSSSGFTADEVTAVDGAALGMSAAYLRQNDASSARPIWDINHVLSYGQSVSSGWEGWPAKSLTSRFAGALMLGHSVQPSAEQATTWSPIGDSTLRPMVATNVSNNGTSPGAVLDAATVAALSAGDTTLGETILEGALNFFRRAYLDSALLPETDTSRATVGTVCGVGGMIAEKLQKGGSPNYYNRLPSACTAVKDAATADGKSYGIAALLLQHGEWNEKEIDGGSSDKETYKTLIRQIITDFRADAVTGIAGQSRPVAVFANQTGGPDARDNNALSVMIAQYEMALEDDNYYLVGPNYYVPDKGGHMPPNGYRWLANQMGKVMARVLLRGERWRPLSPLSITYRGNEILVAFHVPCPPLAWGTPYDAEVARDFDAKGFAVFDDTGASLAVIAAEIVGNATVRLKVSTALSSAPTVRYGGQATFNGNGCLHDSDPTEAVDTYDYATGSGDYVAADHVDLVGNLYPLWNWCVAFNQVATAA